MKPWVPSCAKRCTHLRKAEYVNWSVSETVCRRCPLTTSRTAWARRKTRASFVCFKKVSKVGRASSGKCSLRVRMRVVSRIKYYKNITIPPPNPCLSSSRNKAFSTHISRKLLIETRNTTLFPFLDPCSNRVSINLIYLRDFFDPHPLCAEQNPVRPDPGSGYRIMFHDFCQSVTLVFCQRTHVSHDHHPRGPCCSRARISYDEPCMGAISYQKLFASALSTRA